MIVDGYGSATYGDAFADIYDDWYPANAQTQAAVATLEELAEGGPVLELGCGTGRLCLPLAEAGLDVTGLDASAAMLDRLRAKPAAAHLAVELADMARFELGEGRFRLVFVAFNTLFNLAHAGDQAACFATVARHLAPGGRFVVECFVPGDGPTGPDGGPGDATGATPSSTTDAVELRTLAADRVVLRISRHDHVAQTVSGQHVELSESGVRLRPWHLRYAGPAELDAMAAAAGLVVEARWSGWERAAFDDDADHHVTVYRRAARPPGRP